jgi:hypothetical protein
MAWRFFVVSSTPSSNNVGRRGWSGGARSTCDSTKVQANAGRESLKPRFAVEARQTLQAHLTALSPKAPNGAEDGQKMRPVPAAPPTSMPDPLVDASPEPTLLPLSLSPEEADALATANAVRHDWTAAEGAQARAVTSRCYQRVADLLVSTTDPDATHDADQRRAVSGLLHPLCRRWGESPHHFNTYHRTMTYDDLEKATALVSDPLHQDRIRQVVNALVQSTVRGELSAHWWLPLDAITHSGALQVPEDADLAKLYLNAVTSVSPRRGGSSRH